MVDVSVLILNYNTFHLTCACIQSVYSHTKGLTFEIVLVDNGSTECAPQLFKETFPDIKLVVSKINLGFAKGNNLGIEHATGKTILLLNSDTELLNNSISLAFRRLMESEEVGAVTGKVVTPSGEVQHVAQRFPSIRLLVLQVSRLILLIPRSKRESIFLGEYFKYDQEIYPDWIWATFFLIRRETIAVFPEGKLPDYFFMYEEDKLWGYYLRKAGLKLLFSPLPLVLHRVSGSSADRNILDRNKVILQNEFRVITLTKGLYYAKAYFLLKALQYLSSSYTHAMAVAKQYATIMLTGSSLDIPADLPEEQLHII